MDSEIRAEISGIDQRLVDLEDVRIAKIECRLNRITQIEGRLDSAEEYLRGAGNAIARHEAALKHLQGSVSAILEAAKSQTAAMERIAAAIEKVANNVRDSGM